MRKDEHIACLEREIIRRRKAAVKIVVSLVEGAIMYPTNENF